MAFVVVTTVYILKPVKADTVVSLFAYVCIKPS